jgi:16S rRNA (guanine527-N7)-methyltransferase
MTPDRIAELLAPFNGGLRVSSALAEQFQTYLDLLLRWNARMNLTAVRDPEEMITRHFGESLFAAGMLFDNSDVSKRPATLADVGSGAGFPGIPIKLFAPPLRLTLIESQNKKAAFLREAIRTLALRDAEVFCGRAEQWGHTADVVTLRAVERFDQVLPVAAKLVVPGGRLVLLIGEGQQETARTLTVGHADWTGPWPIPHSEGRVVFFGKLQGE